MSMSKKIFLPRALALLLAMLTLLLLSLPLTSCQIASGGTETAADGTDSQPDSTSPGETSGGENVTRPEEDHTETQPSQTETQPAQTETQPSQPDTPSDPNQAGDDPLAPVFSAQGGVYTDRLALTLSVPDGAPEGTVVRYTTNGSVPTATSTAYASPIRLMVNEGDGGVVRAACFDSQGNRVSRVITNSYVRAASTDSTVFTVMISVSQKDLNAMISAYSETVERPAHVEIVTPDGQTVISQDAGLRLFGGSSRSLAQKSFKLIARKDGYFGENAAYTGKGSFAYPLFSGRVVQSGKDAGQVLDKHDSFILRNGGNDSLLHTVVDPTNATLLRDGVVNNFAKTWAPAVDCSLSQFAVVYINGEYYGLLDMRENLNEDYVKRVYGVDDADVAVIKSELDTTRHCDRHANGGSCRFCNVWFYLETDEDQRCQDALAQWQALCKKAVQGLNTKGEAYDALFAEIEAQVDLESFMQYMALGLYVCNTDWPHNNVKLWKYTGEPMEGIAITDGKWRFMTRDMDMAMGRYTSPYVLPELDNRATVDTFWRVLGNYVDGYASKYENSGETQLYPDSLGLGGLFAFCLKDDGFRASFAAFARTLAGEEAVAALDAAYETAYDAISPLMEAHIQRWGTQESYKEWKVACRKVDAFIKARPTPFTTYLDLALSMYA